MGKQGAGHIHRDGMAVGFLFLKHVPHHPHRDAGCPVDGNLYSNRDGRNPTDRDGCPDRHRNLRPHRNQHPDRNTHGDGRGAAQRAIYLRWGGDAGEERGERRDHLLRRAALPPGVR